MFKKIATVALIGALLSTGVATSHAATLKSGAACTKVGAKTKVGTNSYTCGINPTVKTTKLTWLLNDCLTANKLYVAAVNNQTNFTAQVTNTLDQLKKSIATWQAASDLADQKLKAANADFPAKIAAIQVKIDAATVKSTNAHDKAKTSTGVNLLNWTKAYTGYDNNITRYKSAIDLLNKGIARLQSTKDRAVSQITSLNAQLTSTMASQPALAAQVKVSVTQGLTQLKLACKAGL